MLHSLETSQGTAVGRASLLLASTATALPVAIRASAELRVPSSSDFSSLLSATAAWALLAALAWWTLVSLAVWLEVLAAGRWRPTRWVGAPLAVRRGLLGACGVAVLIGAPAHADVGQTQSTRDPAAALDGVPLPDRAEGRAINRAVVVRAGDSLWTLCSTPPSTDTETAACVATTYDDNRDVIGVDPDLILPGQSLRMPPNAPHQKESHR